MSGQTDPYVRVYYAIINDPKFCEVYHSDARLATWLRLLLVADALYPATAPIPIGTSKAALRHLVDARIVELVGRDQFRIVGLAAERERRSAAGRAGAAGRWSERNAIAMPPDYEGDSSAFEAALLAETSRDKTSQASTSSPQTPQGGLRQRRQRSEGRAPRQLREGSPEIDSRALESIGQILKGRSA